MLVMRSREKHWQLLSDGNTNRLKFSNADWPVPGGYNQDEKGGEEKTEEQIDDLGEEGDPWERPGR